MRSKCGTLQLAVKVVRSDGFEGAWIHGVRWSVLFDGQQLTVEVEDVGVGRGPDSECHRVRVFVAVLPWRQIISPLPTTTSVGFRALE